MSLFSLAHASPVVVELYESQGCSSCPPAEKVTETLKKEFGDQILLLTHHVDYWDYLGWVDTFSSHQSTERQREYAFQFKERSVYTPQMIINGEVGFVGSDLKRARAEIQKRIQVGQTRDSCLLKNKMIQCQFSDHLQKSTKKILLVYSANLPSVSVTKGENKGTVMSGEHTVLDVIELPEPSKMHLQTSLPTNWSNLKGTPSLIFQDDQLHVIAAFPIFKSMGTSN
jgi:hypothetical protein